MEFKTAFQSFDADSEATGLLCADPSLAKDSFREDSDINTIVARFGLTGEMPDKYQAPQYADFENVVDFQTALNAVRAAGEQFMELPATMRERFDNDPQKLMAFLGEEKHRQEAIDLGLVPPPPVMASGSPEPVKAFQSAPADNSSTT